MYSFVVNLVTCCFFLTVSFWGGGRGRELSYYICFPDIKEFEKAVTLLWNWKSRKVLWYFQTGRKYVRAQGLNLFICVFASIIFSTHDWPKGIFNCIFLRQHLRLFHKKIASLTIDGDKREIILIFFQEIGCSEGESGLDSWDTVIQRKTGLGRRFPLAALASYDIIHQKYNGRSLNVSSVEFLKGNRLVKG